MNYRRKGYLWAMLRLTKLENLMLQPGLHVVLTSGSIEELDKERNDLIDFLWTQKMKGNC